MRLLNVLALSVIGLIGAGGSGCLWDPDFFDEVPPEVGPPPTMMGGAAGAGGAGGGQAMLDAGEQAPDAHVQTMLGQGPDCATMGPCGLATISGGGVQLFDLVADGGGGAWAVVGGRALRVMAGGAEQVLIEAPSHLLHFTAGGFGADVVAPLPFRATSLASTPRALYVAGNSAGAGELLGQPFDPMGRSAVVMRVVNQQMQWFISWSGQIPVRISAVSPETLWIAGGPGNADLHLNHDPTPFESGIEPGAPGLFIARFSGLGGLQEIQRFGEGGGRFEALSMGQGGQVAFVVRGSGALPDGSPLSEGGITLAQLGAQGQLIWSQPWPPNLVELSAISVEPGGQTWMTGRINGAADGLPMDLVTDRANQAFFARALPNGIVEAAGVLEAEQASTLSAVAAGHGGDAILLGQVYARGPFTLGEATLDPPGMYLAGLNGLGRATWITRVGDFSPNAPVVRKVDTSGAFGVAGADIYADFEWANARHTWTGASTVAIFSFPLP